MGFHLATTADLAPFIRDLHHGFLLCIQKLLAPVFIAPWLFLTLIVLYAAKIVAASTAINLQHPGTAAPQKEMARNAVFCA